MTVPAGTPPDAARAHDLLPEALTTGDEATGWLILAWLNALTVASRPVWMFSEDPGAAEWLTPEDCPPEWLAFIGVLVGARYERWMSEQQQRLEARRPSGHRRGDEDAIAEAAQRLLAGDRRVAIRRRYDPALGAGVDAENHLLVRVRLSDVPPALRVEGPPGVWDAPAIRHAVLAAIPTGLIGVVVFNDDRSYDDVHELHDDYTAVTAAYMDYDDMRGA